MDGLFSKLVEERLNCLIRVQQIETQIREQCKDRAVEFNSADKAMFKAIANRDPVALQNAISNGANPFAEDDNEDNGMERSLAEVTEAGAECLDVLLAIGDGALANTHVFGNEMPLVSRVRACFDNDPWDCADNLAALRFLISAGADIKPSLFFAKKAIRQIPGYIRDDEKNLRDRNRMIIEMLEILCETPEQSLDVLGSRPPKENLGIVNYFRARAESSALANSARSIQCRDIAAAPAVGDVAI